MFTNKRYKYYSLAWLFIVCILSFSALNILLDLQQEVNSFWIFLFAGMSMVSAFLFSWVVTKPVY